MFLALLLGWIVFAYVFAALAPVLFELLCHLLEFLLICLFEASALLVRLIVRLIAISARAALRCGRWAGLACVFMFYIADEWRRGPQAADAADDQSGQAPESAYAQALACFGLPPGFTAAELERAYRQAIRKAHPDAGGSLEEAQTINAARDLVATARGWK